MTPEETYVGLGQLLAASPSFAEFVTLSPAETVWMARAYALLNVAGFHIEAATVQVQMDAISRATNLFVKIDAGKTLLAAVHRAQAVAEINAPTSVRGAFISAGSPFDAMAVVGRVLAQATTSARIVDPYMDSKALTDFALLAPESATIQLLADSATVKSSLEPAVTRWKSQHISTRPLEARLSAPRALHDRLIIIDGASVWTLTQSLNAFAERSPASIVRIEGDAVPLKIAAYEAFWNAATIVA